MIKNKKAAGATTQSILSIVGIICAVFIVISFIHPTELLAGIGINILSPKDKIEVSEDLQNDLDITKLAYTPIEIKDLDKLKKYQDTITEHAKQTNLPIELIQSIILTCSSVEADYVSEIGEVGLMCLLPSTAKQKGLLVPDYKLIPNEQIPECNSQTKNKCSSDDQRFNPIKNIQAGTSYLADLIDSTENIQLALAEYSQSEDEIFVSGVMQHYHSLTS